MSTTSGVFEIVPFELEFEHEFEHEFEQERGGRGGARGVGRPKPRPRPKPWPRFRDRRDISRYGGGGGYEPEPAIESEPPTGAGSEHVRWVQSTLNRALGAALPVDGVASPATRDAIRDFQRRNRLPASGYIGPDTDAALRRVGSSERREFEFELEWESELTGDALTADTALSRSKALPIKFALQTLGTQSVPGLYRFFTTDGKAYTGMATDLRRRIIQHMWCLSHFGVPTKGHRLVLYRMPGKTKDQIRPVEFDINKHNMTFKPTETLNKRAELEMLELLNL